MEKKLFIDILNPRGAVEVVYRKPARRVSDLKGRTIGLIHNRKADGNKFLEIIKTLLERDYPGIKFTNLTKPYGENYRMKNYIDQLRGIEAAIYSTGD
jgi:hypothetical protein